MSTIIRGTTPSIKYTFKTIDAEDIAVAYLTIKMGGETLLEKDLTTATVEEGSILWTLTQEETLSMADEYIYVRLNWKLADGTRGASSRSRFFIESNDKEVVI